MADDVPYDEIDPPIRELVRVLNDFGRISTIGSCGGHEDPKPGNSSRAPANEWWVTFAVDPADPESDSGVPTAAGWMDLEFLAYLVNTRGLRWAPEKARNVVLAPYAPMPHANGPGRMLRFELNGYRGANGVEPDDLAAAIRYFVDALSYPVGAESPS